jgi:formyl-CoA transferase
MTSPLPLSGLLVLDVATWIAAPAAATVLGDFGAEVIKVEQPGEGDANRQSQNSAHTPQLPVNYRWHLDSRNKRSLALDLKHPAGRAVLDRLIARADILITNFPHPVRSRLKLEYADVERSNPRLIYASFTGYGEEGPDKDQPGFDSTAYFSRTGLLDAIRYEGGPPAFSLPAQGDRAAAMGLLAGILMALYDRERTGKGRLVSSSLLGNGIWSNATLVQAGLAGGSIGPRPPPERPRNALASMYRTRDDRWFQLTAVNEAKHWPALCAAIARRDLEGVPEFATRELRRANATRLAAVLAEAFATLDLADVIARLDAARVPNAPIARAIEVAADPQAAAAKAVVATDIPELPRTVAAPFQLSGAPARKPQPAPALGADTDAVLRQHGFTAEEIAGLRKAGAVA